MKLTKMVFFLVIYIHFFACIWFLIVKKDKKWISLIHAPTDDFYQLYSFDSITNQYLVCIHSAVLSTLGSDILPRDFIQTIMAACGLFFGAIINANIFGELAVIMASIGHHEKEFQKKYASANTVMIQLNLPEDTR